MKKKKRYTESTLDGSYQYKHSETSLPVFNMLYLFDPASVLDKYLSSEKEVDEPLSGFAERR